MSKCAKCGVYNPDDSYYCQNCGSQLKRSEPPVNRPTYSPPSPKGIGVDKAPEDNAAGFKKDNPPSPSINNTPQDKMSAANKPVSPEGSSQNEDITDPNHYSLKWHKWMIYVVLWLWALINIAISINLINSNKVALGIPFLVAGIFEIYTRFQLAQFKQGAFGKLIVCLVINLIVAILNIAVSSSNVTGSNIGQVGISIVWIIGNWIYYSKRKSLFIY